MQELFSTALFAFLAYILYRLIKKIKQGFDKKLKPHSGENQSRIDRKITESAHLGFTIIQLFAILFLFAVGILVLYNLTAS